jgi:Mg/Co/Ni transporter MgtE
LLKSTRKSEIYFPVYTYRLDHPLLKLTRKAEIRNLFSSLHSLTRPPLLKSTRKVEIRNLLSSLQSLTIDHSLFKTIRKAEIRNLFSSLHPLTRPPLLKSTRKAEIRNLLSNLHSSTEPSLVEIDQKSRNQKSTFQFVLIVCIQYSPILKHSSVTLLKN